jgi:hypothetical protein
MANAKHPVPQPLDRELGAVDEGERLRIDGRTVRETRGKAWEAGFSALGIRSVRASSRNSSLPTPASSNG